MTVTEKAAYLKGVVSMLKLEENSDEAKVLNVLVDTIDEMAQSIAELEEQRPSRFSPPALQRRLADSPALGQLGLGHASFGRHGRPSTGVVRTAMKALFSGKAKACTCLKSFIELHFAHEF